MSTTANKRITDEQLRKAHLAALLATRAHMQTFDPFDPQPSEPRQSAVHGVTRREIRSAMRAERAA